MDMPYNTLWKILRKVIYFYPFEINCLELRNFDNQKRLVFALTFLAKMEVDDNWSWKILWGDEALFYQNGTVNAQNCRIRNDESLNVVKNIPLHSPKVTVRCTFTAEIVIGPLLLWKYYARRTNNQFSYQRKILRHVKYLRRFGTSATKLPPKN